MVGEAWTTDRSGRCSSQTVTVIHLRAETVYTTSKDCTPAHLHTHTHSQIVSILLMTLRVGVEAAAETHGVTVVRS